MAWVLDKGLEKLRSQVNEAAPDRNKASDGTIGDEAHQGTDSDHNPEDDGQGGNPEDQVDALDLTHDPANGADMGVVTESIRKSKDRRVSYVIFNRRIYSGALGPSPWVWRSYTGDNPHDHHAHFSVRDDTHDQTQDWQIGIPMTLGKADLQAILNTDGVMDSLPDAGDDPGTDGTHIQWETAIKRDRIKIQKIKTDTSDLVADVASLQGKVDQILAILQSGIPIAGEAVLAPASVEAVATATADELAERAQE